MGSELFDQVLIVRTQALEDGYKRLEARGGDHVGGVLARLQEHGHDDACDLRGAALVEAEGAADVGPEKVAGVRVACGAKLGVADWVLSADTDALAGFTEKSRALIVLDLAAGHLAAGRIKAAFALTGRAVETGLHLPVGPNRRPGPGHTPLAHTHLPAKGGAAVRPAVA
ncbi:hypothetical protein [Streptomyces sp. NPDC048603]|uniref:hypothetical protein n=1 Tax=Streptomyces sp. NPDC048603 TaxID=3365577 RepID=UPI003710BC06